MESEIRCGHEWAIKLTEQLNETELDKVFGEVLSVLLADLQYSLLINKTFRVDVAPRPLSGKLILPEPQCQELLERSQVLAQHQFFLVSSGLLLLPIRHKQAMFGLLAVENRLAPNSSKLVLLAYLATVYINQLATLHHARLDPLTELLNRQTFEQKVLEILAGEGFLVSRDTQVERSWYLAMIDIDHFKRVNDNYGHVIGDEVILLVAQQLKHNFRAEDYVFRYGGEEFAVLFQCDSESHALATLERNRLAIANYRFPQVGEVTISSGMVEMGDYMQVTQLVHRADQALYHSKHQGRNQVTAFSALYQGQESGDVVDDIELF
ncbi:GGDEF domain-containing protein [Pseudoalteromonas fenneropenaei]